MLFYRKISPCLKPTEIIYSNTKDQFHKMPKSKHKGIVPMIHIVKTLIKTTVKVMEKYIETRLNFYLKKKKMLQLTSFDASKILYSSILSGGLSS